MCSATYSVVAADLDGNALVNTATATSVAPDGGTVASDPSTARIDDVVTVAAPDDDLPVTGGMIVWGAAALGAGLLAVGAVMLMVRRRRLS